MKELLFLVPVVGLAGLLFAIFLKSYVIKQDPGTDRMREIADAIAEGARAFLASEYRILVIFVAVLFVVIGVGTRNSCMFPHRKPFLYCCRLSGNERCDPRKLPYCKRCPYPGYETRPGSGIFRRKCYGYGRCRSWPFRRWHPLYHYR